MTRRTGKGWLSGLLALILSGGLLAGLVMSPATAHVGNGLKHLKKHLRKNFYAKKAANNRFALVCDPLTGGMDAQAFVDDSMVSTVGLDTAGVMDVGCDGGSIEAWRSGTGTYEIASAGVNSIPNCPNDTPVVQVTPEGSDAGAGSYEIFADVDDRTLIRVFRRDAAGALANGNFALGITEWAFGTC